MIDREEEKRKFLEKLGFEQSEDGKFFRIRVAHDIILPCEILKDDDMSFGEELMTQGITAKRKAEEFWNLFFDCSRDFTKEMEN